MTTETTTYQSKWGFHACDRETYKKIKRIRHLIEKCQSRNNRFRWFWRKAPQNRVIKTDRGTIRTPMTEPKLFELFYRKVETNVPHCQREACGYHPEQYRYQIAETPEYEHFMKTYQRSRRPLPTASSVLPLLHSVEDIDKLLSEMEAY